jgi:hypothetical protein
MHRAGLFFLLFCLLSMHFTMTDSVILYTFAYEKGKFLFRVFR